MVLRPSVRVKRVDYIVALTANFCFHPSSHWQHPRTRRTHPGAWRLVRLCPGLGYRASGCHPPGESAHPRTGSAHPCALHPRHPCPARCLPGRTSASHRPGGNEPTHTGTLSQRATGEREKSQHLGKDVEKHYHRLSLFPPFVRCARHQATSINVGLLSMQRGMLSMDDLYPSLWRNHLFHARHRFSGNAGVECTIKQSPGLR